MLFYKLAKAIVIVGSDPSAMVGLRFCCIIPTENLAAECFVYPCSQLVKLHKLITRETAKIIKVIKMNDLIKNHFMTENDLLFYRTVICPLSVLYKTYLRTAAALFKDPEQSLILKNGKQ